MLTAATVNAAFDDSSFSETYWESLEYKKDGTISITGSDYAYEVLDSKFGEEGDWSVETFIVLKVGDKVFRKTGHYRSHDGEYWDGPCMEVEPVEKTVTVWENKDVPDVPYGTFSLDELDSALHHSDDWDGWGEMGYTDMDFTLNGHSYTTEPVESIGGEGQGEYAASIFKVGERMFRKEGYYASHYGTDWDGDFEEVAPYEKTVTAYKPI